jgi:cell division protein FtsZ
MKFKLVEDKKVYNSKTTIKVIGVGGGGGNVVNNMIQSELKGVDFIVANTDAQDLDRSASPVKIQLGPSITMGLGAGADPEIGRLSAEESLDEIKENVDTPDMVFITAGMGGGTGTGAAPVIARESKASGALTVGVVTKPFNFEGSKRMKRALDGIEALKKEVDSLIIIPNERLKAVGEKGASLKTLLARADEVLLDAVKGISDLIVSNGFINLDFADVRKVMQNTGTALMGMGKATGDNRAVGAAKSAINSPLLEDISIKGAKGLLMNIAGPTDMSLDEVDEACNYIKGEVNEEADIFWGVVFDDSLSDAIQVTVIATGIDMTDCDASEEKQLRDVVNLNAGLAEKKIVNIRDATPEEIEDDWSVRINGTPIDDSIANIPAYKRKQAANGIEDDLDSMENKPKERSLLKKFWLKKYSRNDLDFPTFARRIKLES